MANTTPPKRGKLSESELLLAFGRRLRETRQELRMLETDFACRLDVSSKFLSELEQGHVTPAFDLLRKLYTMYNINLHYLLDGEGEAFINKESLQDLNTTRFNPPADPDKQELLYELEVEPRMKKK